MAYGFKDNKSKVPVYTREEIDNLISYYGVKTRLITRGGHCLYDAVNNVAGEFESIEAIYNAVHRGDFSNIYTEDYILVRINHTTLGEEIVKLVVADIDYYFNKMIITEFTDNPHHIILTPENCLANEALMNPTAIVSGGYNNSQMNVSVLPTYITAFKSALNNHLVNKYKIFSNNTNSSAINSSGGKITGASNGDVQTNSNTELFLPNEIQIYGTRVFSQAYDVGDSVQQLAYYMIRPDMVVSKLGYNGSTNTSWWLSSVADNLSFCIVSSNGTPYFKSANQYSGIRPLMLFG